MLPGQLWTRFLVYLTSSGPSDCFGDDDDVDDGDDDDQMIEWWAVNWGLLRHDFAVRYDDCYDDDLGHVAQGRMTGDSGRRGEQMLQQRLLIPVTGRMDRFLDRKPFGQ